MGHHEPAHDGAGPVRGPLLGQAGQGHRGVAQGREQLRPAGRTAQTGGVQGQAAEEPVRGRHVLPVDPPADGALARGEWHGAGDRRPGVCGGLAGDPADLRGPEGPPHAQPPGAPPELLLRREPSRPGSRRASAAPTLMGSGGSGSASWSWTPRIRTPPRACTAPSTAPGSTPPRARGGCPGPSRPGGASRASPAPREGTAAGAPSRPLPSERGTARQPSPQLKRKKKTAQICISLSFFPQKKKKKKKKPQNPFPPPFFSQKKKKKKKKK